LCRKGIFIGKRIKFLTSHLHELYISFLLISIIQRRERGWRGFEDREKFFWGTVVSGNGMILFKGEEISVKKEGFLVEKRKKERATDPIPEVSLSFRRGGVNQGEDPLGRL